MTDERVHEVVSGGPPWVRRRIVVWRRLEPGDVRTPGSLDAPESPFLETKVIDVAVPRSFHEEMKRLAAAKAKATALPRSPLLEYEPAGILISAAGGIGVGVWLDYLRPAGAFGWIAVACLGLGVVLAAVAKTRRAAAESAARARWAAAAEKKDYEEVARTIAERWIAFSQDLKRDTGFHTEIRVAEGSSDPLRLASIDTRPFTGAIGMDPDDFLPTEGGGVRYEALHAAGEIVSRLLPGAHELAEEQSAGAATDAERRPSSEIEGSSENESGPDISPSRGAGSPATDTDGSPSG